MSHTVAKQITSFTGIAFAQVTIVNYTVGGETFSPAFDFGISPISGVIMGNVPASQNSLNVPLFPVLDANKVKLYQFVSGSPVEIPATSNLNAVIPVIMGFGI